MWDPDLMTSEDIPLVGHGIWIPFKTFGFGRITSIL
jgi:hypothetical protein